MTWVVGWTNSSRKACGQLGTANRLLWVDSPQFECWHCVRSSDDARPKIKVAKILKQFCRGVRTKLADGLYVTATDAPKILPTVSGTATSTPPMPAGIATTKKPDVGLVGVQGPEMLTLAQKESLCTPQLPRTSVTKSEISTEVAWNASKNWYYALAPPRGRSEHRRKWVGSLRRMYLATDRSINAGSKEMTLKHGYPGING